MVYAACLHICLPSMLHFPRIDKIVFLCQGRFMYCRMLNVHEHLSWRFGHVWCLQFLNLASVMFGILFSYASIIFGQFYFGESMEPRKTRIIKFFRKWSILQHLKQLIDRQTEMHPFCFCYYWPRGTLGQYCYWSGCRGVFFLPLRLTLPTAKSSNSIIFKFLMLIQQ